MLQNPVNTLVFEVGMQQVFAPLVSLTIECGRFCKAPIKTKPMLITALLYLVPLQLVMLLGPLHDTSNPHFLKLFRFPAQFRYHNELVLLCTGIAYTVSVQIARHVLEAKQRRKVGIM